MIDTVFLLAERFCYFCGLNLTRVCMSSLTCTPGHDTVSCLMCHRWNSKLRVRLSLLCTSLAQVSIEGSSVNTPTILCIRSPGICSSTAFFTQKDCDHEITDALSF